MKPEEKYAAEIAGLSDQEKPIVIALAQFQNSEAIDRVCQFCGHLLSRRQGRKGRQLLQVLDHHLQMWQVQHDLAGVLMSKTS
jgi:hypothetical protein